MKKILLYFIPSFAFAIGGSQRITSANDQPSIFTGQNMVSNGGFERTTTGWTASGGTFTSTTTNPYRGNISGVWDSNSASQTLTSTAVTVPQWLIGRNAVIGCFVKTTSGTATYTLNAYDGTNNIASSTITSSTSAFTLTTINFVAPSSGTLAVRLTSVASNEPEITIDNCFISDASLVNISQVNQAVFLGSVFFPGTTNCTWSKSGSSFGGFSADPDCASGTADGQASAPSTKIPAIRFANGLSPGRYRFEATGTFLKAANASDVCFFKFSNGTLETKSASVGVGSTLNHYAPGIFGDVEVTTATGDTTFEIYNRSSLGTANCQIDAGGAGLTELRISVFRYPSQSEIAYRPEINNWKVDVTIEGGNPQLGNSNQTSYVEITNTSLTLTANTGSLPAKIPCSGTNPPTGSTCSVGNESVGVNFDLPVASSIEACVFTAHTMSNSSSTVDAAFQIVETPSNAQTITTEGLTKQASSSSASGLVVNPISNCSIFNFTSAGNKTLRLMYEQTITGSPTGNELLADANTGRGQRNMRWIIRPITQNTPAPILVGSVTSNSTGALRVESAKIPTAGTSITSQSSQWLGTCTRPSNGNYRCTVNSGVFSSDPTCVVTTRDNGAVNVTMWQSGYPASTELRWFIHRSTDAVLDNASSEIICMGPR